MGSNIVSIRLRLALWYGILSAIALLLMAFFSYAIFTRSQYVAQDQVLRLSASHVAVGVLGAGRSYILDSKPQSANIVLRLYNSKERLIQTTPGAWQVPPASPRAALVSPSGPAYDQAAAIVPALRADPVQSPEAAFGILYVRGERWRQHVLPLEKEGRVLGYVEALIPLGPLDHAARDLRNLLFTLAAISLVAVIGLGGGIARRALAPIARLTSTAGDIAQSGDLSRRVGPVENPDELGRLAITFNEMLASLQASSHVQQRFIADASHELRAPLTIMQGNLELIRLHTGMDPEEQREVLSEVERETARLGRLVADMLLLARKDAGVPFRSAQVDLTTVALEAFRNAQRLALGQLLSHSVQPGIRVTGDPDRLRQLVLILLDNALKYTPAGRKVALIVTENHGSVFLVVQDEGAGIPAADQPHVFERFYRADPGRARDPGGTGLGLTIAAWIVEQHGGHIDLKSAAGRGTRVEVSLRGVSGPLPDLPV